MEEKTNTKENTMDDQIGVRNGMRVDVTMESKKSETGTVVYWRMTPPDYTRPQFVSVRLDSRMEDPKYTGTMVAVDCLTERQEGATR